MSKPVAVVIGFIGKLPVAGMSNGRQRAQLAGEQCVAEEGFTEIVGGVAESDDVRLQPVGDFVNGAPAVAAAKVAAVLRILLEQVERRDVVIAGPGDPLLAQEFAQRLDRPQELALFDGEGAQRELDRRALAQHEESFQQRERVFSTGKGHGNTIAVANHLETADRLPHFANERFSQVHS